MRAIFLDIETTGLDPTRHRTIDIAFKIIDVTSGEVLGVFQSIIKLTPADWDKRDPVSIEINGFTWEQVSTGQEVSLARSEIIQMFTGLKIERGNAVFICQNPAFDRGFFSQMIDVYTQENLHWPYHWLDLASMYWSQLVQKSKAEGVSFQETMNLSKNEIAKAYNLPPEQHPHRAMKGVEHLILCYEAVLGVKFNV